MQSAVSEEDYVLMNYHVKSIITFQVEVEADIPCDHFAHDLTQPVSDPLLKIRMRLLDIAKKKVAVGNCQAKFEEIVIGG